MQTKKISLKEIQDVLSRDEMKKIMAGSGGGSTCVFYTNCITEDGFQPGPVCRGESDPVYGCMPVEEECNNIANGKCSLDPNCIHCVPY